MKIAATVQYLFKSIASTLVVLMRDRTEKCCSLLPEEIQDA